MPDTVSPEGTEGDLQGAHFVKPSVQPPGHFHAAAGNVGLVEGWKIWRQQWDNYTILTNLSKQPDRYQTALLLHSVGQDCLRVYNGMKFANAAESVKCSVILDKFDKHFLGESREFFERFKFNQRSQEDGESIEQYVTALRTMSKTCGFCDCMNDKLLVDRVLLGVRDDRMRELLISKSDLDLSTAIDVCKAVEATSTHMKALKSEEINRVNRKPFPKHAKTGSGKQKFVKQKPKELKKCKFCNKSHEMKKECCPAWGQKCNVCHKPNHFKGSAVCTSKSVHQLEDDEYSSTESISVVQINTVSPEDGPIFCNMLLNGRRVQFQLDSGATVSVLPQKFLSEEDVVRNECIHLRMWNHSPLLRAVGKCKVVTRNPATGKKYRIDYVIVKEDLTPLLSKTASEKMQLITVHYESMEIVHNIFPENVCNLAPENLHKEYPVVFSSSVTGTLPGNDVHLTVMDDATPSVRPARVIPESLRSIVKDELDALQTRDLIEEVSSPTDWVSQMAVVQKKSGKVRVCLDPRPLNLVLKREHYPLPVLDDILPQLSNATVFSICDLKDGYLHCVLDDDSSLLTTFATPWGRYKWKRLPFGLKVSSEIFQKRLHLALDGLQGVRCVADDIIIWGNSDAEHDTRLQSLLQKCQTVGIVLNKEKCQFRLKEISFLGHIVSNSGLKADPSKIDAILNMSSPTCKDDIHRLRGMVNYLARYLPKLSDVMKPLNDLTHNNSAWTWDSNHDKAFRLLKEMLIQAPVLAFYNQSKPLQIQTDASATGLGAVMLQDGQPIAYASRMLSDPETRYSVIEKEMLAIVFALEKWNQFTFGRKTTVYSDHKPLECIVKKALDKAPKRLQGMLLRAMAYDVEVKYLQGKDNILADALSRASLPYESGQHDLEVVNAVKLLSLPDDKIAEIKRQTTQDPTLSQLKDTILDGWPDNKTKLPLSLTPYFSFRDELSVTDDLIFKGERLVIPKQMRRQIKEELHIGHNGVEGTLRRAREYVYWPGMNKEIKEWIQTCETCQENSVSQPAQPLMSHPISDRPWSRIGIDLFHHDNENYLIMVCYYSNFFEIEKLQRTTAPAVIKRLKRHIGRYGVPEIIVSDNGPPFSSRDFAEFAKEMGIKHNTISPHNSKANGKAESAVKTAKRLLTKCKDTGDNVDLALLNVRNTPTQGTQTSPAQRFMGRRTRTLLPTTTQLLMPDRDSGPDVEKLNSNQRRQEMYFNRNTRKLKDLPLGATVRVKPFNHRKKWKKAVILKKIDDRSYEVRCDGQTLRRNREHLRATSSTSDTLDPIPNMFNWECQDNNQPKVRTTEQRQSTTTSPVKFRGDGTSETLDENNTSSLRRSNRQRREPHKMKDFVTF
ncbi:uncharacterized protein K02A2.6-like [Strongylocentrotus purpuratus]|uniref:Endonuclease n=1 Tax=Strongylocentrotus purpuratus TaxID=7668 RepID=A0A7M7GII5_STRPU|nr:uncharacterized protein K02A2.6-like [Strongylocentrotus purpuratus]